MLAIPAFERYRQEGQEVKFILGYLVRLKPASLGYKEALFPKSTNQINMNQSHFCLCLPLKNFESENRPIETDAEESWTGHDRLCKPNLQRSQPRNM